MGIFLNPVFIIILPSIIINQFLLHLPAVIAAKDTLRPGDEINSLDPNSTLISPSGIFTLGFNTIKSTNLTYLGIRYKGLGILYKEDIDKIVWVANRDIPMISSGVLMIDESGTLKVISGTNNTTLFNVSNQAVGSTNINTVAVLLDSGNLVLYANATKNQILWQSFDHPTDTLLPGMKLGSNLTLTSWFSSDQIPASGDFTLRYELFLQTPQLVIYRRGKVYWNSGSGMIDDHTKLGFGATVVFGYSTDFNYLQPQVYFTNPTDFDYVQPLFQLSSMGQLVFDDGIFITDLCFPSDQISGGGGGCAISASSHGCRGQGDEFELRNEDVLFSGLINEDDDSNISLSDCMDICWNDCKCKGFSSSNSNGTGCTTWDGYSSNRTLGGSTWDGYSSNRTLGGFSSPVGVFVSHPNILVFKKKTWKKNIWKWILVSLAILVTCAYMEHRGAFLRLWYAKIERRKLEVKEQRRRDDYINQLKASDSFNFGDVLEKGIKDAPDIKIFSLGAILAATNSFSVENKLGQGGYGPVYKGKLFDGREIAIKRLSKSSGQGMEEFKSELILISKLQHTNLVRLYGCCIHQEEKMLIYEFMPNKSLDFFLFAEEKKETLDWKMRFNIIEGVAQGLLYLHKYSRMRVIHRDLKVSNVLLDENMNSKIADFGMARSFQQDVSEAITSKVAGTYGYMAPEYAMRGTFSIKSDVFSFGVLILEIVSGRRNSRFHDLVKYAWELWKGGAMIELKDEALGESFDLKQLLRTIHVGLLCVQDNADERPIMLEVISMLNNEIAELPSPKQPLFVTGRQPVEDSSSENISNSVNGLSITTMKAR